jgi:hypothetical protein
VNRNLAPAGGSIESLRHNVLVGRDQPKASASTGASHGRQRSQHLLAETLPLCNDDKHDYLAATRPLTEMSTEPGGFCGQDLRSSAFFRSPVTPFSAIQASTLPDFIKAE